MSYLNPEESLSGEEQQENHVGQEKMEEEQTNDEFREQLAADREELLHLYNSGMLSKERLLFHESQLDRALESIDKQEAMASSSGQRPRSNVITVRLTDEIVTALDDLVSVNIAKSRSEAASMLITEGFKGRALLFNQIRKQSEEIENIRKSFEQSISDDGFGKMDK